MSKPVFGNFLDLVQSSSTGAATLMGNAPDAKAVGAPSDEGYVELDALSSAKGGKKGKPDNTTDGGTEETITYTYTSGEHNNVPDSEEFNITINFYGDQWTTELKAAFIESADFLSSTIAGDLEDVTYNGELIDDIVIDAKLVEIDGSGGVLGRAGPTVVRSTDGVTPDGLTVKAVMEFDIADAFDYDAAGLFKDIVQHEMMHCLGFGTLWEYQDLIDTYVDDNGTRRPVDDTFDFRFTGDAAVAEYEVEFANIWLADANSNLGIPVETDGGPGTAGGHWDDATFTNELMTGYIDNENFMSDMSIASLADMGYTLA